MTEFAELIGIDQSTVSRYESAQVVPSKTALILLFLLARDDERAPLLESMGEVNETLLRSRYADAHDTIEQILPKRRLTRQSLAADFGRMQFAEESAAILSSGGHIEQALIELIKLYRSNSTNRKLRQSLAQMLPYFEFVAREARSAPSSKPD